MENGREINVLPLLQESAVKNRSSVVITAETDISNLVTLEPSQEATLPMADIAHLFQGGNLVIDIGGNVFHQNPINGNGNK